MALNGLGTNFSAVKAGSFRYPRATPIPATHSSPGARVGTRFSPESTTNSRVLSIGEPMGTEPSSVPPEGTSYTQQPTTVSEGPYSLIKRASGHFERQS